MSRFCESCGSETNRRTGRTTKMFCNIIGSDSDSLVVGVRDRQYRLLFVRFLDMLKLLDIPHKVFNSEAKIIIDSRVIIFTQEQNVCLLMHGSNYTIFRDEA